jgi:AcrR family transcriptional regulator
MDPAESRVTAVLGHRERKRLRTRQVIARAALDLFDRQGFADTTIPQIAEVAGVSPRTVSGYFPHKEELAFPDNEEAFATLRVRLHGRRPEETAAEALRAWIGDWCEQQPETDEEMRTRRRVIRADEDLRAYEQRIMGRAREALTEAIARDLGSSPADLEPRMAAAATLAVFDVLGDADAPTEEALELVDRALRFISAGIAALHD